MSTTATPSPGNQLWGIYYTDREYARLHGDQLRTAIEVLKKLGERIDDHGTHSLMQLPDTRLGDDYAARIEWQTIEQIARLKTVMAQLGSWRDELRQERRQCVTHHV